MHAPYYFLPSKIKKSCIYFAPSCDEQFLVNAIHWAQNLLLLTNIFCFTSNIIHSFNIFVNMLNIFLLFFFSGLFSHYEKILYMKRGIKCVYPFIHSHSRVWKAFFFCGWTKHQQKKTNIKYNQMYYEMI